MTVTELPDRTRQAAQSTGVTVTVYSKPSCTQCDATYRAMRKYGLDYQVVDISKDAEALERVKALGFQQAPVVEVSGALEDIFSGFRPDRIKAVVTAMAGAMPAAA